MKKSCVLVSGGAGYIGSHTAVELISAGYDVVIVDNLSNSDIDAVEGVRRITGVDVPFEKADCCDRDAFARVFEKYDFDSVIHFAASKAVGESVSKPLEYYRNNLMSFMNVIGLMREYGRQNIVFSSSCTVYGEADVLPVTEQTPRKPATSPYGNTKQMCEDILRDSLAAYEGLKGIALRYFNPIGAHPSALIGELPRGVPQNLVPYITQTAAGIRECLSVFGDDYPTPDGSNIRDYIDVVDLAKAHVAAIRRMIEDRNKARYEVFNIGTGRGVSVLELVHRFEQVNRPNSTIRSSAAVRATSWPSGPIRRMPTTNWAGGPSARSTRRSRQPGNGRSISAASNSAMHCPNPKGTDPHRIPSLSCKYAYGVCIYFLRRMLSVSDSTLQGPSYVIRAAVEAFIRRVPEHHTSALA